jgi:hypothetical protein
LALGAWRLALGAWRLALGAWRLALNVQCSMFNNQFSSIRMSGSWAVLPLYLEIGCWKLKIFLSLATLAQRLDYADNGDREINQSFLKYLRCHHETHQKSKIITQQSSIRRQWKIFAVTTLAYFLIRWVKLALIGRWPGLACYGPLALQCASLF